MISLIGVHHQSEAFHPVKHRIVSSKSSVTSCVLGVNEILNLDLLTNGVMWLISLNLINRTRIALR
jgi:hypothetical protein